MKNVAVILSGCGHLDGSEIREAVGTLWGLDAAGATVKIFAPNQAQPDVMNHQTQKPTASENRNALEEAARIARGEIQPLNQLDPNNFDALAMPGGFGAAKTLSTFATQGSQGTVLPEAAKVIQTFHNQSKPIGAICIAPAVVALALKDRKLRLTVGETSEASQEIEKLGHQHVVCPANDCVVDNTTKVVTTPAYMYDDGRLSEVMTGIQKLTRELLQLT